MESVATGSDRECSCSQGQGSKKCAAITSPGRDGREKTTEVLNVRGSSGLAMRGSLDRTMKRVTLSRMSWIFLSRMLILYSSAARSLAMAATSLHAQSVLHSVTSGLLHPHQQYNLRAVLSGSVQASSHEDRVFSQASQIRAESAKRFSECISSL